MPKTDCSLNEVLGWEIWMDHLLRAIPRELSIDFPQIMSAGWEARVEDYPFRDSVRCDP